MTRKEYMEQLKKYLKRLPKEDYDNAIEYFSEYFDEAGPENEQQVMEELGQPKEAARELLLNLLQESVGDSKDITEEKTAALPAAGSYYGESSHAHSRTDSGNLSTTGYSTSAGKKRSPGKIILLAFLVICASPVSIALLFIPILLEETDKIMKAQMSRGADFESGNLMHRLHNMIPLLVPLFISATRRANELAYAMDARCYNGGAGRTKMKPLKYNPRDYKGYAVLVLYVIVLILVTWTVAI